MGPAARLGRVHVQDGEGAGGGAQRPGPRLGAAACDPTLDDKLAALDAAIAARFEAKGANPRRLADGVDVVSFQGGGKKT